MHKVSAYGLPSGEQRKSLALSSILSVSLSVCLCVNTTQECVVLGCVVLCCVSCFILSCRHVLSCLVSSVSLDLLPGMTALCPVCPCRVLSCFVLSCLGFDLGLRIGIGLGFGIGVGSAAYRLLPIVCSVPQLFVLWWLAIQYASPNKCNKYRYGVNYQYLRKNSSVFWPNLGNRGKIAPGLFF
jgi:hypothetical protein